MTAQPDVNPAVPVLPGTDTVRLYQEGIVAGVLGAATVALWFFVIDTIQGRPLYTPTVLGTALFSRGAGLAPLESVPVSLEMVLMFTWVHGLAFAALGGVAARLLGHVERHPSVGFGVLLFFVVFQFAFTAVASVFAAPVLRALSPWTVLVANLLAAAAMAVYLRRQHPGLRVDP
jgi:hypothetical protein